MSQDNLTPEQIAAAEAEAKQAAKTAVEVRVLVECQYGLVNSVVKIPKAEVKGAEDGGLVDSNKEAVAYAKSIAKV